MVWQQFIAVAGVAFLVVLAWRLGALKTARLTDGDAASARFAQDFPILKPSHIFVSSDGTAALLDVGEGNVGAVIAVGDRLATRLWRCGDLIGVTSEGDRLVIETRDMTCPHIRLNGMTESDRTALEPSLSALCEKRA